MERDQDGRSRRERMRVFSRGENLMRSYALYGRLLLWTSLALRPHDTQTAMAEAPRLASRGLPAPDAKTTQPQPAPQIDLDGDGRADALSGDVLAGARRFLAPIPH